MWHESVIKSGAFSSCYCYSLNGRVVPVNLLLSSPFDHIICDDFVCLRWNAWKRKLMYFFYCFVYSNAWSSLERAEKFTTLSLWQGSTNLHGCVLNRVSLSRPNPPTQIPVEDPPGFSPRQTRNYKSCGSEAYWETGLTSQILLVPVHLLSGRAPDTLILIASEQSTQGWRELWSISNFSCSLTRKISPHSMEKLVFHSLLKWKMVITPILTASLIHLFSRGWENVLFDKDVTAETETSILNCVHWSAMSESVSWNMFAFLVEI